MSRWHLALGPAKGYIYGEEVFFCFVYSFLFIYLFILFIHKCYMNICRSTAFPTSVALPPILPPPQGYPGNVRVRSNFSVCLHRS